MISTTPPPPRAFPASNRPFRYLLKTPDKWLTSMEGSKAKRQIQETLAARTASGELGGYAMDSISEEEGEQEEAAEGGSQPKKERQAN